MNKNNFSAFTLLALLALVGQSKTAQAAESYDNCTGFITSVPATITTQGTWCLKQDLATAISNGNAITINTNNVTIDCNDFKLGGLAAGAATTAVGIAVGNKLNITVRHCNIRGFSYGVSFWGGGFTIEDNRFDSNTNVGMYIEGDGSTIRRNRVTDTGGSTSTSNAYGIQTVNSVDVLDNTISGVTPSGNGVAEGIYMTSNPDGSVAGNRIRQLLSAGSGAGAGTVGINNINGGRVTFRDNDVIGDGTSGSVGISCFAGTPANSRLKGNVISGFVTGNDSCSDDGGNVIVP